MNALLQGIDRPHTLIYDVGAEFVHYLGECAHVTGKASQQKLNRVRFGMKDVDPKHIIPLLQLGYDVFSSHVVVAGIGPRQPQNVKLGPARPDDNFHPVVLFVSEPSSCSDESQELGRKL